LLFKIKLAAWTAQEELSKHAGLTSAMQPSGGAGRAKSALAMHNFGPFSGTSSPICMLAPKQSRVNQLKPFLRHSITLRTKGLTVQFRDQSLSQWGALTKNVPVFSLPKIPPKMPSNRMRPL